MTARCAWCGRFGGRTVTYRLSATTAWFTRTLCPPCGESALHATTRADAGAGR